MCIGSMLSLKLCNNKINVFPNKTNFCLLCYFITSKSRPIPRCKPPFGRYHTRRSNRTASAFSILDTAFSSKRISFIFSSVVNL